MLNIITFDDFTYVFLVFIQSKRLYNLAGPKLAVTSFITYLYGILKPETVELTFVFHVSLKIRYTKD